MRKASVEAAFYLVWARLGLGRRTKRAIRRWTRGASQVEPPTPEQLATAVYLSKITMDVAIRLPWNSTCLVQSVALTSMLRRRSVPVEIRFGVRKDSDTGAIEAHAWVTSGDKVVLDSDGQRGYTAFKRHHRGP